MEGRDVVMTGAPARWCDLEPEPSILEALEHAGVRPSSGQDCKRRWSEMFANGCAVAVARELQGLSELKKKKVLPAGLESGTEPLTPLGAGTSKRIDVTVADAVLGLEIGFSLKGLNFQDGRSGNFDKNLTGRLYELGDEMRLVHEHLPHAFMAGVFFLPIEATEDKKTGNSSFANTVVKLRRRTGRLDVNISAHAPRCDRSFVGLYCHDASSDLAVGAVRFLDVATPPPRRGRPLIAHTLSLSGMVRSVVDLASDDGQVEWGPAEQEL